MDHDEIKHYPPHLQEQICSSIFQNAHRKDMHIPKQTIDEHFFFKVSIERDKFIKKLEMKCIRRLGDFQFVIRILYCVFVII